MKKTIASVCLVLALTVTTGTAAFAADKTTSVSTENGIVTVTTAETMTAAEIQEKIDELKAKSAEITAKHNAVITAHPGDSAKQAKIEESTNRAIEKHNAAIEYYQNLLDSMQ